MKNAQVHDKVIIEGSNLSNCSLFDKVRMTNAIVNGVLGVQILFRGDTCLNCALPIEQDPSSRKAALNTLSFSSNDELNKYRLDLAIREEMRQGRAAEKSA